MLKRNTPLKNKSKLKAKKGLARGEGKLDRSKPIPKKNAKRRKKLSAEQFGPPEFGEFVREYGCVVALQTGTAKDCVGPVQHCHRKTRGSGGRWRNNSFGACVGHHQEQGRSTLRFEKKYGLDLDLWCCAITHQFDLKHGEAA